MAGADAFQELVAAAEHARPKPTPPVFDGHRHATPTSSSAVHPAKASALQSPPKASSSDAPPAAAGSLPDEDPPADAGSQPVRETDE